MKAKERMLRSLSGNQYIHALHDDIPVDERLHKQQWLPKIIVELKNSTITYCQHSSPNVVAQHIAHVFTVMLM